MIGRGVIITAIVAYVGVTLGCMLSTSAQPASPNMFVPERARSTPQAASRLPGLPFRGVAMQLQRVDWIETEYRKSLDEIAALGADTVLFVVDAHMENGSSSVIYVDMRLTPTPAQLGNIIDYAKAKGLRVVLMPIVLLDKPRSYREWRGTIKPESWPDWWESYRALLHHYSWIAEVHKVDVLVIGSELVSTETKVDEWRTTIAGVRKTFKGMLTYSANWDHYSDIPFWDQLDLIGMNSYYTLGENNRVRTEEIQKNWAPYKAKIVDFSRRMGKPVVLLEAGWCNLANAADEPWDYTRTEIPIDLDLQKRLYEGFFQSWWGEPRMAGFMIWEWPPGDGGPRDRGYTPEGKPAEKVLREWFKKPRWNVE